MKGQFEQKYNAGDLIYGFLFLRELPKENNHRQGVFKCPYCGNEFKARVTNITGNRKGSCGCKAYVNMARYVTHGHHSGGKMSSEYSSWHGMIQRCFNPKCKAFERYGAAGITICERWKKFENFLADMGVKPTPLHTIDRFPNKKGSYEPGNCRWATRKQQSINRSVVHSVQFNGKEYSLPEICTELGLRRKDVTGRKWYKKCTVQEAFDYVLNKHEW